MLERITGNLEIGSLIIGASSTFAELTEILGKTNKKWSVWNISNRSDALNFQNILFNGNYFSGNVYFDDNMVCQISFSVDKQMQEADPWREWTEENELKKSKYMKDWLHRCIGSVSEFVWGTVWCGYDAKSGSAHIVVRYSRKDA